MRWSSACSHRGRDAILIVLMLPQVSARAHHGYTTVAFDNLQAERAPVNACRLPALTCSLWRSGISRTETRSGVGIRWSNIINVFRRHDIRWHTV